MGAYFHAPLSLILAIALMVTAAFHFLRTLKNRRLGNRLLEAYLTFCDAFDTVLHFFCILTIFAFGYQYGWMEAVKLLIVCLVMPVIGMVFAAIMGTNQWNRTASIIAIPIAVLCGLYIFPHLSWFGIL